MTRSPLLDPGDIHRSAEIVPVLRSCEPAGLARSFTRRATARRRAVSLIYVESAFMWSEGAALWRGQHLGKDLRQSLPLQVNVGARVPHRCVQACVTEPLTDRGKINPCFQKMDRRCVAQRMRMDP